MGCAVFLGLAMRPAHAMSHAARRRALPRVPAPMGRPLSVRARFRGCGDVGAHFKCPLVERAGYRNSRETAIWEACADNRCGLLAASRLGSPMTRLAE
jgi:hypothetical protein